jgi:NitT/TauT family transport system substrate-binding protein
VLPHGIYAREDIKKVEDLKGKSVAVSAPNSMPDLLARAALAKYGITADQVKLAAVGGDRERYQALAGGVVEGAVVSNEYQPAMPKTLHLLVAGRDAVPNFLRVCLMTSGKVLKERGDDVVKFLAAEMQSLRFALSHKAETVALTQEIIHAKPDDPRPAFVYDDAVAHHAVDAELPIPAEKLNWMQEQMVMAGKLKAVLPLDQISAPEYREKAAKLVGK